MTTSHCCRVLCSHLHSSEQIQLTCRVLSTLPFVGHRIKNATFYALIWSIFDFCRGKTKTQLSWLSLKKTKKQRPVLILYLLRSCVGVQTNCHFIDYRTFQVCFCCLLGCDKEINQAPPPFKTLFLITSEQSRDHQIMDTCLPSSFFIAKMKLFVKNVHFKHNHLPVWTSLTFSWLDENV